MKKILFFVLSICFFVIGCQRGGNRPDDLPKLHPCTITVTQNNIPLEGASVTLQTNDNSGKYNTCSGVTNSLGIAQINTYGFSGVPKGNYKITVSKIIVEGGISKTDEFGGGSIEGGKAIQTVDAIYTESNTTPCEIKITESSNSLTLDVGNQKRNVIPAMPM
jgi:hypothetical protein